MRVSQDSRTIKPGEYFVAVKGEKYDGHDFIDQALKKGAAGVLEEAELYQSAKERLAKVRPEVIAITGSTGKTSTKEAITTTLSEKFKVLKSEGNFNTALGLSIQIVNNLKSDHQKFVAEVGMERLGEIAETCQLIEPKIGVITSLNRTHLEKLGSLENIIKAKAELIESLPGDGVAVINKITTNVRFFKNILKTKFHGRVVWCGYDEKIRTPLLGRHQLSNASTAAAVGRICGLPTEKINRGLAKIKPLKGRLNLLEGRGGSRILDDTYNSSPESALAALDVLKNFDAKRRVAILGDMLELGSYEEKGHREVLKKVGESRVDLLITKDSNFRDSRELAESVVDLIKPQKGDIILVKGSQGVRMEKVVRALLDDPAEASKLLVRQDIRWQSDD